ncbi:MAG: hypothetical protein QOC92_4200 [Acidimicrobiaceae bacterium]|jgi:hypothetical protein
MDIARLIRDRVRDALHRAADATDDGTNIAISGNVGSSGHTTIVYSDNDVTIVERDGKREVIRRGSPTHRRPNG